MEINITLVSLIFFPQYFWLPQPASGFQPVTNVPKQVTKSILFFKKAYIIS